MLLFYNGRLDFYNVAGRRMNTFQNAMDLVEIYQVQYSQVDKLWNYFSIVSIAVAGFVVGSERATKTFKESIAVVLAYLSFCIGNNRALVEGQDLLYSFSLLAEHAMAEAELNIQTFGTFTADEVFWFQISISSFVCVGILLIGWLRRSTT
jgi:hypothetical protein